MESDADVAASEAALELVITRLGARAAAVEMLAPGGNGTPELATTSSRGIWNPEGTDGTALAALRTGRATRALDLRDGSAADSDVAAPVMDAISAVAVCWWRAACRGAASAPLRCADPQRDRGLAGTAADVDEAYPRRRRCQLRGRRGVRFRRRHERRRRQSVGR